MIDSALLLLESAINRALRTDLQTLARLQELDDKKVRMEISDWNLYFYILPKHNGVELRSKISGEPDTTISGTLPNLFRIGIAKDKQHAVKQHKIQFNGDAHVGIAMQQILSNLDIDWEEHLAQIVGDGPATFISKGVRQFMNFGKDVVDSLQRNTSEFIHHEAKLSPTKEELEEFYDDVTKLRHAVDRLEQKIKQC
jgi:ubiquinone biosynthesis protein UbiJ